MSRIFNLSEYSNESYQEIILHENIKYVHYPVHCHNCTIFVDGNVDMKIINLFNQPSLTNYNNVIKKYVRFQPLVWNDNSCAMDSVLLFLCIFDYLTEKNIVLSALKCEPDDKLKVYEIFKYIRKEEKWENVQKYREELLNKIVAEKKLQSRFCDVQDLLNWLFKNDDVELPINDYLIINGSMSESKLNAFKDLSIIY